MQAIEFVTPVAEGVRQFLVRIDGVTYSVGFSHAGEARTSRRYRTPYGYAWRRLNDQGPTARRVSYAVAEALSQAATPEAGLWAGVAFRLA